LDKKRTRILGIIMILAGFLFPLLDVGLFVQITLEFGLFLAWLLCLPFFLCMTVGLALVGEKSLKLALKAWRNIVIITSFPFVAFIAILPTAFQILSIGLIVSTLSLVVYLYLKRRHGRQTM